MNMRQTLFVLCALVVSGGILCAAEAGDQATDLIAAVDAAHHAAGKAFSEVRGSVIVRTTMLYCAEQAKKSNLPAETRETVSKVFQVKNGSIRTETRAYDEKSGSVGKLMYVKVFTGGEYYFYNAIGGQLVLGNNRTLFAQCDITEDFRFRTFSSAGLPRYAPLTEFLSYIDKIEYGLNEAGLLTVSCVGHQEDGICEDKWLLDPNKDYLPLEVHHTMTWLENGQPFSHVNTTDKVEWRTIDSGFVPSVAVSEQAAYFRLTDGSSRWIHTRRDEVTVLNYEPAVVDDALFTFDSLGIPEGTKVFDEVADAVYEYRSMPLEEQRAKALLSKVDLKSVLPDTGLSTTAGLVADEPGTPGAARPSNLERVRVDGPLQEARNKDLLARVKLGLGVYYRAKMATLAGLREFVDSCVDYSTYGPAGKDGKMGTLDDLAAPL